MEAESLQRLHDTLSKLAPRGKVGGLGYSSFTKLSKSKDPTLPNNPLYANFVRAGSGAGLYHKRNFDENANESGSVDYDSDNEQKQKKKKKSKKLKKDKKTTATGVVESSSNYDSRNKIEKQRKRNRTDDEPYDGSTETVSKKSKKDKTPLSGVEFDSSHVNELNTDAVECTDADIKNKKKKSKKLKKDKRIKLDDTQPAPDTIAIPNETSQINSFEVGDGPTQAKHLKGGSEAELSNKTAQKQLKSKINKPGVIAIEIPKTTNTSNALTVTDEAKQKNKEKKSKKSKKKSE